jgi:hypothetical protein
MTGTRRQFIRLTELQTALDASPAIHAIDVLCGDLNEDTVVGSISGPLTAAGLDDALAFLGVREPTHPWSSTYYHSQRWAIIDHITARNLEPVDGAVIDFDTSAIADELTRIEENFRRGGSDHYPIRAEFVAP